MGTWLMAPQELGPYDFQDSEHRQNLVIIDIVEFGKKKSFIN